MTQRKKYNSRKARLVLKEAPSQHLVCRDLMHAWEWVTDLTPNTNKSNQVGRRLKTVTRVLACTRCETQRTDEYEVPSFTRIRTMYSYPEGYLARQNNVHVKVADVRAEVYRRMVNGEWS